MNLIKLLPVSALALVFASCSQDEVVNVNDKVTDPDVISFAVKAEGNTRAANIFCANNTHSQFDVFGAVNGNLLISKDNIEKAADGTWENKSGVRYWPSNDKVKFFAASNYDKGTFAMNSDNTGAKVTGFEVNSTVTAQTDFLYAVKEAGKSDAKAELNFRHALSQVVFAAKNNNANLHVVVEGVKLVNVNGKGDYTLPTVDTDNANNHPYAGEDDGAAANSRGTWSNTTTASFEATFDAVTVGANTQLTNQANDATGTANNAFMVIPTKEEAWTSATTVTAANLTDNAYIMVKCLIYNVGGDSFNADKDVCLWGEKKDGKYSAAWVAIPANFDWKEGFKYTYTIVFGNGNGGWDPAGPTPVLVPITFTVDVDEFLKGDVADVTPGVSL